MKRRLFIQSILGAAAALFTGRVATASAAGFKPSNIQTELQRVAAGGPSVFTGDIMVLGVDGVYRRAEPGDEGDPSLCAAVSDSYGGFHYMREGVFSVQVTV